MREQEQEFLCILAAICLHASGSASAAVDNAQAIVAIVNARCPAPPEAARE
jgi:hypothetical protein